MGIGGGGDESAFCDYFCFRENFQVFRVLDVSERTGLR